LSHILSLAGIPVETVLRWVVCLLTTARTPSDSNY
ncbi:UNVERIFIED_CONTAM: SRS domain protein, partial [Hammondia hammondi]